MRSGKSDVCRKREGLKSRATLSHPVFPKAFSKAFRVYLTNWIQHQIKLRGSMWFFFSLLPSVLGNRELSTEWYSEVYCRRLQRSSTWREKKVLFSGWQALQLYPAHALLPRSGQWCEREQKWNSWNPGTQEMLSISCSMWTRLPEIAKEDWSARQVLWSVHRKCLQYTVVAKIKGYCDFLKIMY